jgi:tRNA (cytidine/uridine-2'-O-)-methyltransferase
LLGDLQQVVSERAEQPVAGAERAAALLQVVLHEPEIPNNTGNIGRTCVATGCGLHLIRPLAFDTSEKACRRAGLDYWPRLQPREHENFEAFLAAGVVPPRRLWFFTTKSARYAGAVEIAPGDGLVFGKETRGLPDSILQAYPEQLVTLPMMPGERSLNLATAVCAAVYLAMDGFVRRGEVVVDEQGRIGRR